MFELAKRLWNLHYEVLGAENYLQEQAALRKLVRLVVPDMKLTGETDFPPPLRSPDDITVILANHLADADQMLVMAGMNWREKSAIPVKFTGFTYSSFQYGPVVGPLVGRTYIGLEKGESNEEIEHKISWLLEQKYNTWMLFPEGTLFDKDTYKKSLDYQSSLGIPTERHFHEVLYPRGGAIHALLKLAGHRVKYIVDATLGYEGHDPRTQPRSFVNYPSATYGALCGLKVPSMHIRIYHVSPQWQKRLQEHCDPKVAPPWLINLWRLKNKMLRKKRVARRQKQHEKERGAAHPKPSLRTFSH